MTSLAFDFFPLVSAPLQARDVYLEMGVAVGWPFGRFLAAERISARHLRITSGLVFPSCSVVARIKETNLVFFEAEEAAKEGRRLHYVSHGMHLAPKINYDTHSPSMRWTYSRLASREADKGQASAALSARHFRCFDLLGSGWKAHGNAGGHSVQGG